MKILIVEDEVVIAMMLEDTLLDFGCQVEMAADVDTALRKLGTSMPDGVLLDMNIHGMRPIAIVDLLVARSVPFLLVTGYGVSDSDPPAIKAAPRLQKPFDEAELGRLMVAVFVDRTSASQAAG